MLNKKTKHNILIIRAHGIGFYFLLIIYTIFLLISVGLFICCFISTTDIYLDWIVLTISTISFFILIYIIIKLFRDGKVIFKNNIFITNGQNQKVFPLIKQDCDKIISYKQDVKLFTPCITFILSNGEKKSFHIMQYSKKQIINILIEIQKRGGLQNQEIKLSK